MHITAQRTASCLLFALVAYLCAGLFSDALAQQLFSVGNSFTCVNGIAQGALLQISPCAGSPEDDRVFSYFVCRYEQILNEAMGRIYCSVLWELTPAVQAALTLLITLTGASFLMGLTPFTAKELAVLGAKFCLVLAFATNSEYMIGIGYALFVALAKEGIVVVLDYLFTLPTISNFQDVVNIRTGNQVYSVFDKALADILGAATAGEGEDAPNRCQNSIFAMIVILAAAVPPLAFIAMYFLFRLVWMAVRAVFGYCQGLLGITFLTVLSPIYVSFALFKPTRTLFDKWVKYMISFGFQMVIVFAFIGMLFFIMKQIGDDFQAYMDLVQPHDQAIETAPGIINPISACGICKMQETDLQQRPQCAQPLEVLPITEVSQNKEFMEFTAVKGLAMVLLFYVLDIMIGFVPEMARHLAGPKYAGQLGGGGSNLRLPGEQAIGGALGAGGRAFMQSPNSAEGVVRGVYAAGSHVVSADGGVVDTAIRSLANPAEPTRNLDHDGENDTSNSTASNLFAAAAGLTGAAAVAKHYLPEATGGGAAASGDGQQASGQGGAPSQAQQQAAQQAQVQQQERNQEQGQANAATVAQLQSQLTALGDNPSQSDVERLMANVPGDAAARAAAVQAVIESGELSAETANLLKRYSS